MLRVEDLHAWIEGKEIVKGVDLEVNKREIVVVTGPNGSGKSTLARTIMGDPKVEVKEGSIIFKGEDITDLPPEERFERGIFLTFQVPPEFEGVKIGEFLMKVKGREDLETLKELKEIFRRVGLKEEFLFRELHRGLSGGERKRLELAQALFLGKDMIILDEIDSGVDIESVEMMISIIKDLKKRAGILYITHNPLTLKLLEDERIIRMKEGRVVENGR